MLTKADVRRGAVFLIGGGVFWFILAAVTRFGDLQPADHFGMLGTIFFVLGCSFYIISSDD